MHSKSKLRCLFPERAVCCALCFALALLTACRSDPPETNTTSQEGGDTFIPDEDGGAVELGDLPLDAAIQPDDSGSMDAPPSSDAASELEPFVLGADISSLQEAEANGATYFDVDGTQRSMLEILKRHHFNYIRLRTFVDPLAEHGYATCQGGTVPYCGLEQTVTFAKQIKQAGMGFLLDLHYSDTWADPGKQLIPASFRDAKTIQQLAAHVRAHTLQVLRALAVAGASPDMVQVGNEITPGLLIHVPSVATDCYGAMSTVAPLGGGSSNWNNLAMLLQAGLQAVHEVDPHIKTALHIESTDDLNLTHWWVENALSHGLSFDVLGLSCYREWQGDPAGWKQTTEAMAAAFPTLSFMIAEYSGDNAVANKLIHDLPDGRGVGTFFWEPTLSANPLFDHQGKTFRARAAEFAELDQIHLAVTPRRR